MRKIIQLGMIIASLPASAHAQQYITIASEPESAPNRSIYVADFDTITRELDGGGDPSTLASAAMQSANPLDYMETRTIYKINVYQVMENGAPISKGGPINFIHYLLGFKCKEKQFRIEEAVAYDRAARTEKSSMAQWMAVPDNWVAQGFKIACKSADWQQATASAHKMVTDYNNGKPRKNAPKDPFAPLLMQVVLVQRGAFVTEMIDKIWATYWPDAKQPGYETAEEFAKRDAEDPADLAKLREERHAQFRAQAAQLDETVKKAEKDLGSLQAKFDFNASADKLRGGRKMRQFEWQMLQVWQGKTEDDVIAKMGRPDFTDAGNRHLLSYSQKFDNRVLVGMSDGAVFEEGLYTNCAFDFVTISDDAGTFRVADIVMNIDSSNIMETNSRQACGSLLKVPGD
jgi:hypothetical protein